MRALNKVAIVTGASSGIGRATAIRLAAEGAAVVAFARRAGLLAETVEAITKKGGRALAVVGDVTDAASRADLFRRTNSQYGRINILFNNAGIGLERPMTDVTLEEWDRVHDVNLRSAFAMTQLAVPLMRGVGGGSIIQMASVHGIASRPNVSAYAATRGAMVAMTRQLATELGKHNIRVNCVLPGATLTEQLLKSARLSPDPQAVLAKWAERQPLGRVVQPEEVAGAVLFLATDDSSGITGVSIPVDAGLLACL